jgi:hypothetical protein
MLFEDLTCDFVGGFWGFICKLLFSGKFEKEDFWEDPGLFQRQLQKQRQWQ